MHYRTPWKTKNNANATLPTVAKNEGRAERSSVCLSFLLWASHFQTQVMYSPMYRQKLEMIRATRGRGRRLHYFWFYQTNRYRVFVLATGTAISIRVPERLAQLPCNWDLEMTLGSLGAGWFLVPVATSSFFETLIQVSARVQKTFDGCSMAAQPLNKEHTTAESGL